MNSNTIYNVTQINNTLSHFIAQKFKPLFVKGEISSFKTYSSGHAYFILKDNLSEIKCVYFNYLSSNQNQLLIDNVELVAYGELSIYKNKGQVQFIVTDIHMGDTGKLWTKYLYLKNKLRDEGLFDKEFKKQLPLIPQKIGIICSESGAVIHDIINILKRRSPYLEIFIFDTPIQGSVASKSIIDLIESINKSDSVDEIIIARGGGSLEDFQVFNDEELIRTVFNSTIPIISAIGHESDFTLLDLVSDYRASTPSEAAEICAPNINDLNYKIDNFQLEMINALNNLFINKSTFLNTSYLRLSSKNPKLKIKILYNKLNFHLKILDKALSNKVSEYQSKINYYSELFNSKDIYHIKKRGFALVKHNYSLVKSVSDLNIKDNIILELVDGNVRATVNEVYEEK